MLGGFDGVLRASDGSSSPYAGNTCPSAAGAEIEAFAGAASGSVQTQPKANAADSEQVKAKIGNGTHAREVSSARQMPLEEATDLLIHLLRDGRGVSEGELRVR